MEEGRGLFPLGVETARSFAARRIALVGEAAHVIPPIGAQGLNLGLRDVATISELVVEAHREGRDVGGDDLLARYDRMRRADVTSRTVAVDVLNRSLLSDFLPVQASRGLGLYLIDRIAPLRRALMREGVEPAAQPRLMRGERCEGARPVITEKYGDVAVAPIAIINPNHMTRSSSLSQDIGVAGIQGSAPNVCRSSALAASAGRASESKPA